VAPPTVPEVELVETTRMYVGGLDRLDHREFLVVRFT